MLYTMTFENPPSNITPERMMEIEAQAAHMLQVLKDNNTEDQATIPENIRNIQTMIADMRAALEDTQSDDYDVILSNQAKALDIAFRRLLCDADDLSAPACDFIPMKYAAAFKAQEQFCRTLRTLNHLKRNEKPKKRVLKRNERTEGFPPHE